MSVAPSNEQREENAAENVFFQRKMQSNDGSWPLWRCPQESFFCNISLCHAITSSLYYYATLLCTACCGLSGAVSVAGP